MLTPERREELAALLADETRFRALYPKAAEYLETAAGIPGTGDDVADGAFDIRLLHYLTGAEEENPYWAIVGPAIGSGEPGGPRRVNGGRPNGSARLGYAQTVLQEVYAYAIPSPETLGWIADMCDGRGLLEIGAGRGYWAGLLARQGIDTLAFDSEPPNRAENVSFRNGAGHASVWHDVGGLDDLAVAREAGEESSRALFLCWPPGWGNPMSAEALESYERSGGDRVIYVGEPRGGKTATVEFFDRLDERWQLTSEDPDFVAWWNLNDRAQCWTRR